MAERDQLGGFLGGGDAGHAGDLERIALWDFRAACAITSGRMLTKAWARAVRLVGALAETSTIRAAPASS